MPTLNRIITVLLSIAILAGCATGPSGESGSTGTTVSLNDSMAGAADKLSSSLFGGIPSARLAVLPFTIDPGIGNPGIGLMLQDEILSAVFRLPLTNVELYERAELNRIIEEQNLALSGLVEESVEIGRIVATDQVVVGQIALIGDLMRISARIIDVETGGVVNAVTVTMDSGVVLTAAEKSGLRVTEGIYDVVTLRFAGDVTLPDEFRVRKIVLDGGRWTEYNAENAVLASGDYTFLEDRTIGVIWSESFIEQMVGGTTVYEYTNTDGIFSLRIGSPDGRLIGFVELNRR